MGNNNRKNNSVSNWAAGLIMIGISILMMLILFGVFNPAGKYIADFFLGTFGLSFYGITIACLIIGVLKLFNFKFSASVGRIFEVIGIYSLFILAFHATSYEYMSMTSSYGEYIAKCYYEADTAGGVIGAILMYPLLKVNYAFSIVFVALLLFGVIAVTMFGGRVSFNRDHSHSVKYDKKKRKTDEYILVDNDLKNVDANGNKLKDIGSRSRLSDEPIRFTSIDEDEYLADDENIKVEYKDNFPFNNDSNTKNADDSDINELPNANRVSRPIFEGDSEDKKRAEELFYGNQSNQIDENNKKPLTDKDEFLAAIDKMRSLDNTDYADKYLADNEDYEEYTTQARDKIQRENMAREEQDRLNNLNKTNDSDLNSSDLKEETYYLDEDNNSNDNYNDYSRVEHDEDNNGKLEDNYNNSSNDEETGDDSLGTDDEEVKDETNTYDIDDFASSLDKIFKVDNNADSKYDVDQLGDEASGNYANKDDSYRIMDEIQKKIEDEDSMDNSDTDDINLDENNYADDNIDNEKIEEDNIDEEATADSDELEEDDLTEDNEEVGGKHLRKRRSDFGGTHVSQHPVIGNPNESANKHKVEENNEPQFVNPFANKQKEETTQPIISEAPKPAEEEKPFLVPKGYKYNAPPISLLKDYVFEGEESNNQEIKEKCELLEANLNSFGIPASVQTVVKGPAFFRIELAMEMGAGKSVNAIKNKGSDIEFWLGCNGHVNILAPIPGKSAIGIEVPTSEENRRTVGLKEVFNNPEFNKPKYKIPFALGVDIENKAHVCDVETTPHLLIAGSTGSGKSVGIAAMLNSILYRCSPDEVKLILIDPKKVELNDYEYLPHMLIPTPINNSKQVINALDWLIQEMERRYTALSKVHCSNIGEYNEMAEEQSIDKMPYIVLVVDEVADLMLELKKNLEERINKLAAKSRAAGIHIVLATQRPSVDIITGSIKANLPSRIAFATVQAEDSRTILGMIGAEKLLRKGDMLFMDSASAFPTRIQGAFISKKEVVAITNYVRENNKSYFDESIKSFIENEKPEEEEVTDTNPSKPNSEEMPVDERFVEALEAVINAQSASISLLQRKLGIGYPRAGKIYDQLTKYGYIDGKSVLITHMQFMKMFGDKLGGDDGGDN